jgi:hypothetical protein
MERGVNGIISQSVFTCSRPDLNKPYQGKMD